jgi:thiol-disulfide isomerase/thioredoxin
MNHKCIRQVPLALTSGVVLYLLLAVGCKRQEASSKATTSVTTATVSTPAGQSPSAIAPIERANPYREEKSGLALPHHKAMQLAQPVLEPTPSEDPSQYAPAAPPWPDSLTPVYGSELVERIKASGKRGVLLNAWASWCGPCKVEMPMLVKLRETYKQRGIDVWFVSVNQSAEAQQVVQVLRELNVPAPHYVAKGLISYFIDALSPTWQGSLPATFLFDGTGRLRYFWGAHVFEEELEPVVEAFLAGKAVDGVANVQVRRSPEGSSGQ